MVLSLQVSLQDREVHVEGKWKVSCLVTPGQAREARQPCQPGLVSVVCPHRKGPGPWVEPSEGRGCLMCWGCLCAPLTFGEEQADCTGRGEVPG